MIIDSNYHLPNNAMWVCNDRYNGIASVERFVREERANVPVRGNVRVGELRNKSISKKYA